MTRRVIVSLHLPLELSKVARLLEAVGAEYPGLTVDGDSLGTTMELVADPDLEPPAVAGVDPDYRRTVDGVVVDGAPWHASREAPITSWAPDGRVLQVGPWHTLDPTTRDEAIADWQELRTISDQRPAHADNVVVSSTRSYRWVG